MAKRSGGCRTRRASAGVHPGTRSTIEVMLKPFARARNDVDANQSSCSLMSRTFTRSSVNMAVMVDRMIQETRRQKSNHSGKEHSQQQARRAQPTAGEKSKANNRQHQLKLGEVVTTIPTIDFNAENVEY